MLVGSVLCLISVLLFGLDGQDVGIEYFEVICNVSRLGTSKLKGN